MFRAAAWYLGDTKGRLDATAQKQLLLLLLLSRRLPSRGPTFAVHAYRVEGALHRLKHQGACDCPDDQHRYQGTQDLSPVVAKGVVPAAGLCGCPGCKDGHQEGADV